MTAIVDTRITEKMRRSLMLRGFSIIELPPFLSLGEAVRSHPDTLIFRVGECVVSSAEYAEAAPFVFTDLRDRVKSLKITFSDDTLSSAYPSDCAYNALVIGESVFCRTGSISHAVLHLAKSQGKTIVDVKQGYPACSTLALGDNAAITADKGMAKAMREHGIRVYEIEQGNIALPPHEYGFIGGACGVFRDKVYFFGNYKSHPSRDILERAMDSENFSPVSLSDEPLMDLGGILFFD